ncbi:MAG: hypothetical protein WDN46_07815 [Methylocella sp.]
MRLARALPLTKGTKTMRGFRLIVAICCAALVCASPSFAASKAKLPLPLPIDPLGLNGDAAATTSKLPIPLPFDPLGLNETGLQSPDQMVDKVRAWVTSDAAADLAAAQTVAKAAGNTITAACWTPIQAFVAQVQALPVASDMPKIHLAVDIEIITDLEIALLPNSPIVAGCSSLANFQLISAKDLVSGILTGATSLAALAASPIK